MSTSRGSVSRLLEMPWAISPRLRIEQGATIIPIVADDPRNRSGESPIGYATSASAARPPPSSWSMRQLTSAMRS